MPRQQWWHNPAEAQVSEEQLRGPTGHPNVHTQTSKPGSTCSLTDEMRWPCQSIKICSKVCQLRVAGDPAPLVSSGLEGMLGWMQGHLGGNPVRRKITKACPGKVSFWRTVGGGRLS